MLKYSGLDRIVNRWLKLLEWCYKEFKWVKFGFYSGYWVGVWF